MVDDNLSLMMCLTQRFKDSVKIQISDDPAKCPVANLGSWERHMGNAAINHSTLRTTSRRIGDEFI